MIKQSLALIWINCKSFPLRIGSALSSILSIACVAAVILGVLAMLQGMLKTMERSGLDNTLLVMRAGALSELNSVMFPAEVNVLVDDAAIRRDGQGRSLHSAEMFVSADYRPGDGRDGESLAMRGVSRDTYAFRPHFQLEAGRHFVPGRRQVLVGRALARRMPELKVGATVRLGNADWTVSGIFRDNRSVFESELWADLTTMQSDFRRGNSIQSLRLALRPGADIEQLRQQWQADPRLNVRVVAEKTFFARQGEALTGLIRWIGLPVAAVMALGAVVAALNTMYAAIHHRQREIAVHRAIGFSPVAIALTVLSEAVLLAGIGGLLGILPLYLLFDGWSAATQHAGNLSQMIFNFEINLVLMTKALLAAVLIGLLGGLLPAVKATRIPVTRALNAL